MITFPALIRFTELRLNTMCLNFEHAYSGHSEDAIHDLRVSMRRLLTLLDYLSFLSDQHPEAAGEYKVHHRKLKRCLKSLNHIRDLQTQIHTLENIPSGKPQPLRLLDHLKSQEKNRLSRLSAEMDQWTLQKTRGKIREVMHNCPINEKEMELKSYLYINYLTQELHSAVHFCQKPDLIGCHRLRIRLKEYRYHLEMLEHGFGIKQILLGAIKEWQDDLGALQDLRVLLEQINSADIKSDPDILAFRATVQSDLDKMLQTVREEVHAIRFETQLI